MTSAIGNVVSQKVFTSLLSQKWKDPIDPTTEPGVSVDDQYYYNERDDQEYRIPGPTEEGGVFWGKALGFVRNFFLPAAIAATSAYFLTRSSPSEFSSINPDPVLVKAPIPEGAVALQYTDLGGQTQDGYKVNTGGNNYEIYDRNTKILVERKRNGLLERGKFESQIVREGDRQFGTRWTDLIEGTTEYTPELAGKATFKINEKNVTEIRIEVPSDDIILAPNPNMDGSKVIDGIIDFVAWGMTIYVTNGTIEKVRNRSGSEQPSLSSGNLTETHLRTYIFGNGFENDVRPEDTPDPLIESFIDDLEKEDNIVNSLSKLVIYLYEQTTVLGNSIDWFTDFQISDDVRNFIAFLQRGGQALVKFALRQNYVDFVPAPLKDWFTAWRNWFVGYIGVNNDLVQEAIDEMEAYIATNGPIHKGITFVHSGATAPLLTAIERMQYDVHTVIAYEGPHPDYKTSYTNPHLKRIINVRGTAGLQLGDDFVPFLGWAEFGGVENINIEIKNAFHSDFSYDPVDHVDQSDPYKVFRKDMNKSTNEFMRRLYKAAEEDISESGVLLDFLTRNSVSYDQNKNIWEIDLGVDPVKPLI